MLPLGRHSEVFGGSLVVPGHALPRVVEVTQLIPAPPRNV